MKKEKTLQEHFVVFENLLFIGLVAMVASTLFKDTILFWILFAVGFLIMMAACVYHWKYYKCPHCGGRLNVRGVPKFCPDCGGKIE